MLSKKNMVAISVVIVALILLLVPAVFLFSGIRGFKGEEAKLAGSETMLDRLYARKPFPSEDNVVLERDNVETLKRELEDLIAAVKKGEVAPQKITPSTFIALYQQTEANLRGMAAQSGTVLPAEFAFGFQRYRTEGTLPSPEDVPRLTQQLVIIENLARILFEEKVKDLTWLEREEFEVSASSAARRVDRTRDRSPRGRIRETEEPSVEMVSASSQAGLIGEDEIFAKFRFVLEYKTTEKGLRAVLNRLASHGMFVVVTRLSLEKTGSDIMPIPPRVAPGSTVTPAAPGLSGLPGLFAAVAEKAALPVEIRTPSWEERVICGEILETPMKIRLELAVYRFKERGEPGDGI